MSGGFKVLSEIHYAYFVTCTIVEWLPIFQHAHYRNIVLDSLAFMREHKRTQLNAFVVMPTHLHAVLWPDEGVVLSDVLRDLKRFTSRSIVKKAVELNDDPAIRVFIQARAENRAQRKSHYQVWQKGSRPEAIFSAAFAKQKIDYIHNNPVKAGLVARPEEWERSSARAYMRGETTFPSTDIIEF